MSRLLKKAWPGSKVTISNEVKCHHYSIDTIIEFKQRITKKTASNSEQSFLKSKTNASVSVEEE